ncbi:hypothetical protein SEPCBS119000_003374 [Sporothrix epigloea]|uniref:Pentatricopeptide repeat protein n=1 Tax=Sporothrix epigloea TaxID=1892477 RepID=A0ABP0DMJ1_9PEZI
MGSPWRRLRPNVLSGRTEIDLTPIIRAGACWICTASYLTNAVPVSRRVGRCPPGLVGSRRLTGAAVRTRPAEDKVVSWTDISREEEERRQRDFAAKPNGLNASAGADSAANARQPSQGDILIESFAREPLVPRPATLSALVVPAVKYENYRETARSKLLHEKSVNRQARLEAIRQAQLKPLPDWRAVLQRLVGNMPRQRDALDTGRNGIATVISAMSLSPSPPRSSGSAEAASSLARLYGPDPLKQHLLQQLSPDASAGQYHWNAMSFALHDNSPSVNELLHGVDETLWKIAGRTGCVLRLYRRDSSEARKMNKGTLDAGEKTQVQEEGSRPWLLTLSGTIPSVYRAANEVTNFAKDALPVTIGNDVLLKDRFRRDVVTESFIQRENQNETQRLPIAAPGQTQSVLTNTWSLVSSSYYIRDRKQRDDAVFAPHVTKIGAHQIRRPDDWTPASLERYVAALTNGRPPAHLAPKLYPQRRAWSRKQPDPSSDDAPRSGPSTDSVAPLPVSAVESGTTLTDGGSTLNSHDNTVVNLLLSLFHNEAARQALSMSALKMALAFMCRHGETYRPEVRSLFERAESVRVPMDSETYNIMLASQVKTQDLRNFGATLALMKRRGMKPDLTTWLLFMRLFESEEVKRHILRTMHASRPDLLDLPDALQSIAQEMVEYDAQRAVMQRRQQRVYQERASTIQEQEHAASIFVDEFIGHQTDKYGPGWLSRTAANRILEVFGTHGLFCECMALLTVLRQDQLLRLHKEAYREQQHRLEQSQEQHSQRDPLGTMEENTDSVNVITYNIVVTHAKLHNSLPKAMAVVRHMEEGGLDIESAKASVLPSTISAQDLVEPLHHPISRQPALPVATSVAPDSTTLQMLFEMAHQRRLPHLLGALWAYASVTRKTTHLMRKRAGQILATGDLPGKTPLVRALHVLGPPSMGKNGSPSPIATATAASERIAQHYKGWEPAVPLSRIMQEALDRDKMLLQDRIDRNGRSNAQRPPPSPLRILLRRKANVWPTPQGVRSHAEESGLACIEVQTDWMLPVKPVVCAPVAEEAAEEAAKARSTTSSEAAAA